MRRLGALLAGTALLAGAACAAGPGRIVVGSKNFTEQILLGEMVAALIERRAGLAVDRRLGLTGTFVCHKALTAGEIDLYVEYTGTALAAILKLPPLSDPREVFRAVSDEYARRFGVTWLPPLGFDNTFALVVRKGDAAALGLTRISDLAKVAGRFRAGFGPEFIERADGYRGLAAAYGLTLRERPREMDLGLIYRALAEKQVDVVAGSSTDGLIEALDLVVLQDDRRYFPPYEAAVVVREKVWEEHPGLRPLLEELSGAISDEQMRRMNRAVDGDRRSPAEVALEHLRRRGLVPAGPAQAP